MRLIVNKTGVSLVAETLEEASALTLAHQGWVNIKVEKKEPAKRKKNGWAYKRKEECALCGKKVKVMRAHMRWSHPEDVKSTNESGEAKW